MASFRLFDDDSFHFETLRVLGSAPSNGSDISEVFAKLPSIKVGDFESYSAAFYELATRVEHQANRSDRSTASGKVSARNAFFRAATYYRAADFYLHGNPLDARIMDYWEKHLTAFDSAIALLPHPGRRVEIQTLHGFYVPAIFFKTWKAVDEGPRPTLILGNGFDGAQEEMYHNIGYEALERGFNVMTYEGPGQPAVRRYQGLGFIAEWEKVITPIVDYLHDHAVELNVDTNNLALWGHSMGGVFGLRAVAFEKRIKAFIACDGVWNAGNVIPKAIADQIRSGEGDKIWRSINDGSAPPALRWLITHGFWVLFDGDRDRALEPHPDLNDILTKLSSFNVEDTAHLVECKVFVGDADKGVLPGQPEKVAAAIGDRATYHLFKSEDGAGDHCQVGASTLLAQVTLDWFEGVTRE